MNLNRNIKQEKEQKKNLFACTSKEVAIIKKLRSIEYGKLYIIVEKTVPRRIGIVNKLNLDDNIVAEIITGNEKPPIKS